jgi:hypothetical protein
MNLTYLFWARIPFLLIFLCLVSALLYVQLVKRRD